MSSSDDKPQPGSRSATTTPPPKRGSGDRAQTREQEMGSALRSVYQRAVDEKVPDDLMDLLGKLG